MLIVLYVYPYFQGYFDEKDDYQIYGVFYMQENTPCEMSRRRDVERKSEREVLGVWGSGVFPYSTLYLQDLD